MMKKQAPFYVVSFFVFAILVLSPIYITEKSLAKLPVVDTGAYAGTNHFPNHLPKKLLSGWDANGLKLYNESVLNVSNKGNLEVKFSSRPENNVSVSEDNGGFKNFWTKRIANGKWEPSTFKIFDKYVNPGETTVVDFGTWIGPTLLYHGQFSRRSFGIEADPTAFAVVQYNVELNRKLNPSWGNHVSVDSGCVSAPKDTGKLTMKAGGGPGQSMSGIGEKVSGETENPVTWEVQCYTLYDIFANYWNIQKPYKDVLIKIDVESYECKLVPSFYDWLKDEHFLPKMFLSFHHQIEECSDDEFEGVLKVLKLYDHVLASDGQIELPIQSIDVAQLKLALRKGTVVVYKDALLE